jgi:hypothetical protein
MPSKPPPARRQRHGQPAGQAPGQPATEPISRESRTPRARCASEALVQMVTLMREFPHWAIWRTGGNQWRAARIPVAGGGPPRPGQVLTWIHAETSQELRIRIRDVDAGA